MPIGSFAAKWVLPTIIIRKQHETLGMDDFDLVIECRGLVSRSMAATAATIRDSLVFYFTDHA
jgi:hypothetical protein